MLIFVEIVDFLPSWDEKMIKKLFTLLSFVLLFSGCVHDKKGEKVRTPKKQERRVTQEPEIMDNINIPLAGEEIRSYFDDKVVNLEEFVVKDVSDNQVEKKGLELASSDTAVAMLDDSDLFDDMLEDFSWVQKVENGADECFLPCYFGFNKYDVAVNQEENVEINLDMVKKIIAEGDNPKVVIEGHACHSCGSGTYNMVLSEKRAKAVADRFISAGVPRANIKIVSRGQECPALDENGDPVTGDRKEQWPNRRVEVRVVYS